MAWHCHDDIVLLYCTGYKRSHSIHGSTDYIVCSDVIVSYMLMHLTIILERAESELNMIV